MRFQDAARDARAVVYAGIQAEPLVAHVAELLTDAGPAQRVLARAVMNGETTDPDAWRATFPMLFEPTADPTERRRSEAILAASLSVAERGEQVRSQVRGAIVEELTARLLARRVGPTGVRRERRILFDGVRAEIHPYDVTVEGGATPEAYDCKWGARGINADVLYQLDDARTHAADEDERLTVALVVFDAARSCGSPRRTDRSPRRYGDRHDRDARRPPCGPPGGIGTGYLVGAVPSPLRRGRTGRAAPNVRRVAPRTGCRLAPLDESRLRSRLPPNAVSPARPAAEVDRHHPRRFGAGGPPARWLAARLGARAPSSVTTATSSHPRRSMGLPTPAEHRRASGRVRAAFGARPRRSASRGCHRRSTA
jgi:hypothetical protein